MSATPAAELVRLKIAYQNWQLTRAADGFAAVKRATGRRITAGTTGELEARLTSEAGRP